MQQTLPSTSLVIATYNWPEALELCLLSVLGQKKMPDEIVIADDGSTSATKEMIDRFRSRTMVPIQHIWHADEGFKLAQIRNKATVAAKSEYIIQIDGDLILHSSFVNEHINASKAGHFIGGSRVILDKVLSEKTLLKKNIHLPVFTKGISNSFNGIHSSTLGKLLSFLIKTTNATNIRGCNISYWKKDFLSVNGYNEEYKGWGREDTDLVFRFYNSGLKRVFFKLRGVAFHLWHKEADRNALSQNDHILQQTINTKATRTTNGSDRYHGNP